MARYEIRDISEIKPPLTRQYRERQARIEAASTALSELIMAGPTKALFVYLDEDEPAYRITSTYKEAAANREMGIRFRTQDVRASADGRERPSVLAIVITQLPPEDGTT